MNKQSNGRQGKGESSLPAEPAVDAAPPDHEAVARRAFELYCDRGFQEGNDLAHWYEAECQLAAEQDRQLWATPSGGIAG